VYILSGTYRYATTVITAIHKWKPPSGGILINMLTLHGIAFDDNINSNVLESNGFGIDAAGREL
jgi:hypothetical protein